jgi:hypothetical protein
MLWSGVWAWCHEPGAASSEAENRPRVRQPLERGGESPEGYRVQSVGGSLWFIWVVGLSTLGCGHMERIFRVCGAFICVLLFFEKGGFPGY